MAFLKHRKITLNIPKIIVEFRLFILGGFNVEGGIHTLWQHATKDATYALVCYANKLSIYVILYVKGKFFQTILMLRTPLLSAAYILKFE